VAGTIVAVATAVGLVACTNSTGGASEHAAQRNSALGAAVPEPAPLAGAANSAASGDAVAVTLALTSAKIRTADLTVAVRGASRVAQQADEAESITERAGGEVDADDRTGGSHASATLRLLVPPTALSTTLTALSRLGTEQSRQLSTTDVTEKVADVNSRVASAQQSIARLRTLFGSATKVADVIAIEDELSQREADLESLEAQQRALTRQTAMATITLRLVTAAAPAVVKHHTHRSGFVGGLQRGWDGFTAAVAWTADALGTLLPFLLFGIVVALGARWAWPRLRRPARTPESGPLPG